jgi:hypothetical protein
MLELVPLLLDNSVRSWTQRPPTFRTQIRVIGGQNESNNIIKKKKKKKNTDIVPCCTLR